MSMVKTERPRRTFSRPLTCCGFGDPVTKEASAGSIVIAPLLRCFHHQRPFHHGVQTADVVYLALLARGEAPALVRSQVPGFNARFCCSDAMWQKILVGPDHGVA